MKKFFLFSFFTSILVLMLLPAGIVSAECLDANGNRINLAMTPSQCTTLGGTWNYNNPPNPPAGSNSCTAAPTDFQSFVYKIICIIGNSLIPLAFSIAILGFVWGVVNFVILGASDETKKTQGRQLMIWGILALAVMMGVWGLAKIVSGTFGLNTSVLPTVKP